jgi:hypothetical protein
LSLAKTIFFDFCPKLSAKQKPKRSMNIMFFKRY